MKALFIGRFQPFHNGHLKAIRYLSDKYDEIIIGIGSSQYSNTIDNPFSSDERMLMIKESLKQENIINYKIILIPDIHNPPKWVDHVLSINSDFDVVVSNNDFTKQLFLEKGFKIQKTPLFNKKEYSGRVIRRKISDNESWENLVPKSCIQIIKKAIKESKN
ncbi:MAG: nicotinamide-nucleotide adenylyltransferase [Candidatus Thermoplasmatota archaeon]|nr:nicotinamide-nucleotide adenylyltransferase [Candidatus Thermoplasmatota archaeon]